MSTEKIYCQIDILGSAFNIVVDSTTIEEAKKKILAMPILEFLSTYTVMECCDSYSFSVKREREE